jgi:predicted Zn-dependent protease
MTHAHATRRAQILARFGRFREAVETLEAAVAQDPANEELRLELASMKQRSV